jgi:hypothetical protein
MAKAALPQSGTAQKALGCILKFSDKPNPMASNRFHFAADDRNRQ